MGALGLEHSLRSTGQESGDGVASALLCARYVGLPGRPARFTQGPFFEGSVNQPCAVYSRVGVAHPLRQPYLSR